MRKKSGVIDKQVIIGRFFSQFYEPVRPWVMELVRSYKEHGDFTQFPTFIADYYDDRRDKEISLLSCLLLAWKRDVHCQVEEMRDILGEHPWEWFTQRHFVTMTIGRNQNCKILSGLHYWQVGKFFDMIWDAYSNLGCPESLEKCFPMKEGVSGVLRFYIEYGENVLKIHRSRVYADIIDFVLRATDGIGVGLWCDRRRKMKCPRSDELNKFLRIWINEYSNVHWDYEKTISLFGFDDDTDFFYFWLAWTSLARRRPKECSRFATVFWKRYSERHLAPPSYWRMYLPKNEL